jgi:hypothetical protein
MLLNDPENPDLKAFKDDVELVTYIIVPFAPLPHPHDRASLCPVHQSRIPRSDDLDAYFTQHDLQSLFQVVGEMVQVETDLGTFSPTMTPRGIGIGAYILTMSMYGNS